MGIALGEELLVLRGGAILDEIFRRFAHQSGEQRRGAGTAGRTQSMRGFVCVILRLADMIQAGIEPARVRCLSGVDALQVFDDRFGRTVQAVEIQTIEPGMHDSGPRGIVRMQPADEGAHIGIAPHPRRKTLEVAEGIVKPIIALAADMAVEPVGIGPVGLHRDRIETMLDDQPAGDVRTHRIELVRAMAGFAQQYERTVADHLQQRIIVAVSGTEYRRTVADNVQQHGHADLPRRRPQPAWPIIACPIPGKS